MRTLAIVAVLLAGTAAAQATEIKRDSCTADYSRSRAPTAPSRMSSMETLDRGIPEIRLRDLSLITPNFSLPYFNPLIFGKRLPRAARGSVTAARG